MSSEINVIDTSSLIEIRERMSLSAARRDEVFGALTLLVEKGELVYPKQLVGELERFAGSKTAAIWAKKNEIKACRYSAGQFEALKKMFLTYPGLTALIESDKLNTSEHDQADPYVVALALSLVESGAYKTVRVITEDKNDKGKMSIFTACSIVDIKPASVRGFLERQGIKIGT